MHKLRNCGGRWIKNIDFEPAFKLFAIHSDILLEYEWVQRRWHNAAYFFRNSANFSYWDGLVRKDGEIIWKTNCHCHFLCLWSNHFSFKHCARSLFLYFSIFFLLTRDDPRDLVDYYGILSNILYQWLYELIYSLRMSAYITKWQRQYQSQPNWNFDILCAHVSTTLLLHW